MAVSMTSAAAALTYVESFPTRQVVGTGTVLGIPMILPSTDITSNMI